MGMYCLIWAVYLLSRFLAPYSGTVFLDLILVLSATSLLVILVLLVNRRIRREREIVALQRTRDDFERIHASLGGRPFTSFFR
jgi:pilus assembly protein TadC